MRRGLLFLVILSVTLGLLPNSAWAAPVNCEKIMDIDKRETFRAEPSDVRECVMRGWDPPVDWRNNGGKSAGVRAGGAGGFSYGTVQAPESSPGARKAPASVSKNVITSTCSFKARIKVGIPPKIDIPKGSCLDFLKEAFTDKNGATNTASPPAAFDDDTCPAEADTTGIFGQKSTITASATITAPCGAATPLTRMRTTLNKSPGETTTHYATTDDGTYVLNYYRKVGADFLAYTSAGYAAGAAKLPTYLCTTYTDGDGITHRIKTIDLTPPVQQVFLYGSSDPELYLRLKSRQTMGPGMIPGYDSASPEMYLRIPIVGGVPVPPADCDEDTAFTPLPSYGRDIIIQPIEGTSCEKPSLAGTPENQLKKECAVGVLSDTQCIDPLTGTVVGKPKTVDNWVFVCPSGAVMPTPASCPEEAGLPTTGCISEDLSTCETVTVYPTGEACQGKVQYAVLKHPNLIYPVGSTAKFYKTIGGVSGHTGYAQVLAEITSDSLLYMLPETKVILQSRAPEILFSDGAFFKIIPPGEELKVNPNEQTLIVNAPGKIDPSTRHITLVNGGKLLSSGGLELQNFTNGTVFTLPGSGMITLSTGRSISLPSGYLYPAIPTTYSAATASYSQPYLRMPIDNPK